MTRSRSWSLSHEKRELQSRSNPHENHELRSWSHVHEKKELRTRSFFLFLWASCSNHCLAALDLGVDVEQPFDCLIIQNRQAMQSMKRLMDWTLDDNVSTVCSSATRSQATEEAIPNLYKQERKRPTPVRRHLSRTQARLGRVISGVWVPVWGMRMRSLVGLSAHSAFH